MGMYMLYLEFRRGYLEWKICRTKRKTEQLRAKNAVLLKQAKDGLVQQLERRNVPDSQRVYLNEVYKVVLETERMAEEFDAKRDQEKVNGT